MAGGSKGGLEKREQRQTINRKGKERKEGKERRE